MFCTRCGTSVQDGSKFCPSCGLDLSAQTPLGRTTEAPQEMTELDMVQQALQDEYEIQKELGRGGMAIVFKAKDKALDREVAVKVLPFSLAFDAEFVERFQREARTAARLEHPSIIPIYRVGKSGRVIYFVMKFLRGTSLSDVIEKKGPMPPAEIRKLLIQTASALGYAHKGGIVHRDIKPDNIMFDELGHAVVTDFGIAKAASGTKLTGTGMSIGTPHYMSPEQAKAQSLDGRSDIYSLGVVAYQCLTGSVPFDGEDAFSIGYKHIMEDVPEPASLPTAEHKKMWAIIKQMMAKNAADRFQDAEALVKTLEGKAPAPSADAATAVQPAAEAATVAMPSLGGQVRPSTPTTPMPRASIGERPQAPKKKKRSPLIAASVVLLVLGGGAGGGYFWANSSYCPSSPDAGVCAMLGFSAPVPQQPVVTPPVANADSTGTDSAAAPDSSAAARPESAAVATLDSQPAAARPTTGTLRLTGVPNGARVTIGNGEPAPPRAVYEGLAPGSTPVRVQASGYENYTRTVNIRAGETTEHRVSMTREVVAQCDEPTRPGYNEGQACFDAVPRFNGSPIVNVSAVQGNLPARAIFYVNIGADGTFQRASPAFGRSDMEQYPALAQVIGLAVQHLRGLTYQPATKNNRAVAAWFQVPLFLQRQ